MAENHIDKIMGIIQQNKSNIPIQHPLQDELPTLEPNDLVLAIVQNLLNVHVLSPEAGFNQVDGTFALFKFNKEILLEIIHAKDVGELTPKYKQVIKGYAKSLINHQIENVIEK
jgi:hypothetical protein